jgi:hypothetical protein
MRSHLLHVWERQCSACEIILSTYAHNICLLNDCVMCAWGRQNAIKYWSLDDLLCLFLMVQTVDALSWRAAKKCNSQMRKMAEHFSFNTKIRYVRSSVVVVINKLKRFIFLPMNRLRAKTNRAATAYSFMLWISLRFLFVFVASTFCMFVRPISLAS